MKNPMKKVFKKKKSSEKRSKNMINSLRILCEQRIPAEIAQIPINEQGRAYYMNKCRFALNDALIEFALGCNIDLSDGGKISVKFNENLPKNDAIAQAATILSIFIQNYEQPLMARFNAANLAPQAAAAGDMEIPADPAAAAAPQAQVLQNKHVLMISKIDNKHLAKVLKRNGVLGADLLDAADLMTLCAYGEKARKKANRNKALIIGGVAILLTGTAIAGFMYYKHKKEEKMECVDLGGEAIDVEIPDIDDADLPDDDDVPQVPME